MKLKHIICSISLGLAAVSASATPLDAMYGNLKVKLGGLTTETNTTAGTNETTWGIGSITEIDSYTTGNIWQAGSSDGSYLYYMIYGIADMGTTPSSTGGFDIYNTGATGGVADGLIHIDIYRTTTRIASVDGTLNAAPGGRMGYDSYSLFSALGPAYLKVAMGPGVVTVDDPTTPWDESQASMYQHAQATNLPTSGTGQFFANVVGGTAGAQWDTNGQYLGYDMAANFTLRPNYGPFNNPNCSQAQVLSGACFAGQINDPIIANKLPEPGSLALLGLGLGLAGFAGKRRRA